MKKENTVVFIGKDNARVMKNDDRVGNNLEDAVHGNNWDDALIVEDDALIMADAAVHGNNWDDALIVEDAAAQENNSDHALIVDDALVFDDAFHGNIMDAALVLEDATARGNNRDAALIVDAAAMIDNNRDAAFILADAVHGNIIDAGLIVEDETVIFNSWDLPLKYTNRHVTLNYNILFLNFFRPPPHRSPVFPFSIVSFCSFFPHFPLYIPLPFFLCSPSPGSLPSLPLPWPFPSPSCHVRHYSTAFSLFPLLGLILIHFSSFSSGFFFKRINYFKIRLSISKTL